MGGGGLAFGNVSLFVGVVTVIWFGISHYTPSIQDIKWVGSASGHYAFFGIACFSMSAHAEALTIEQFTADKEKYLGIIDVVLFIVFLLYSTFAGLCYALFGNETQSIIFLNMSPGIVANTVKASMCLAILFNYPITLLPALQLIERSIYPGYVDHSNRTEFGTRQEENQANPVVSPNISARSLLFKRSMLRFIVVVLTIVVTRWVKAYGAITSLVGGVAGILAFVFPPLLYLKLHIGYIDSALVIGGNVLIVIFGFYGSLASVWEGFTQLMG